MKYIQYHIETKQAWIYATGASHRINKNLLAYYLTQFTWIKEYNGEVSIIFKQQ